MRISNVTALSFKELSIRHGVDVRIEDGRIASVVPSAVGGTGRPQGGEAIIDEETIDGSGCYLIPGLVNSHAHTAMTLLRGSAEDVQPADWFNRYIWMYEKNLRPDDVYTGTLLGAAEMLLSGVTSVADHYFHMERAFTAYEEAGMRANLAWALFGVGDEAEENFARALDFSRSYADVNPRIRVSLGPHSPYLCPDDFLRRVVSEADRLGLPMHIHVSETAAQVEASLAERGKTPVKVLEETGVLREGTILAHAYYAGDEDLRRIAAAKAGAAHCAKTYLKFADIHDFLPRAIGAGLRLGLGTDGAASNNSFSLFEVARDAALLAKAAGGDPERARIEELIPLLSGGGEVIGLENYGNVEPGAPADLVLIDPTSPNMQPEYNIWANLLYSLSERNVDTVLVDGRVVVRKGRLLTLDTDRLFEEAREASARIIRRDDGAPMQRYEA